MSTFLFILILLGCSLIVRRHRFTALPGLSANKLNALFLIKVAAGICLGWIYAKNTANGGDYWTLHKNGLAETELLKQNPLSFLTDWLLPQDPNGWGGWFDSVGSHWNDLRNTIVEKFLGILNLITNGNFYSNTVVFDLIGFFGVVALYRTWLKVYPKHNTAVMISCFLLPSPLIFMSGLHKDLFIFTFTCFSIYLLYQIIYERAGTRRYLMLVLCLTGLLLLRNYVAIALLPAAAALWLTEKRKMKKLVAFSLVYGVSFVLIIVTSVFMHGSGPLHILVSKHEDFRALKEAHSQLPMFELKENIGSFISNLPTALDHALLKPDPLDTDNFYMLAFAEEMVVYMIALLFALYWERKNKMPAFTLFMVCFALTGLLFIGYIVPNAGSIIRYRAFYLPFLVTPMLVALARRKTNYI